MQTELSHDFNQKLDSVKELIVNQAARSIAEERLLKK